MSRMLEQVRDAVRTRHYSIRTEEAYIRWIRVYILSFSRFVNRTIDSLPGRAYRSGACLLSRSTASLARRGSPGFQTTRPAEGEHHDRIDIGVVSANHSLRLG